MRRRCIVGFFAVKSLCSTQMRLAIRFKTHVIGGLNKHVGAVGFEGIGSLDREVLSLQGIDSWHALEVAEFPLYAYHQIEIFNNLKWKINQQNESPKTKVL